MCGGLLLLLLQFSQLTHSLSISLTCVNRIGVGSGLINFLPVSENLP